MVDALVASAVAVVEVVDALLASAVACAPQRPHQLVETESAADAPVGSKQASKQASKQTSKLAN